MFGRLPENIDPIQLADQGAHLNGTFAIGELARLAALCLDDAGVVTADLEFTRTEHGLRLLRAKVEATLHLSCQRCLQPMDVTVRSEPLLALFRPDEVPAGVPDAAEEVVVEAGFSLRTLVEDEIILAMPMMPKHPPGECQASPPGGNRPVAEAKTDRPNPFAVLEKLRK